MSILTTRKAEERDRHDILAISRKIWDGDDYIPSVIDAWYADTDGDFAVCESSGKIAGFAKLSLMSPVDVWFEGLRKDRDTDVHGIGKALGMRFLERCRRIPGIASIRFSTHRDNSASIALNEHSGWRRIGERSVRWINPADQAPLKPGFIDTSLRQAQGTGLEIRAISGKEAERALHLLCLPWIKPWAVDRWRVYPCYPELIKSWAREKTILGGFRGNELEGVVAFHEDHVEEWLRILVLGARDSGTQDAMLAGALSCTGQAERPLTCFDAFVPPDHASATSFDRAGFGFNTDGPDFLIYEFPLELLGTPRP